ncbi:MAG: hypothetical protein AABZ64_06850 [Nitrospinota bacterium]
MQVKTNAKTFGFWLLSENAKKIASPTHIYVFVNLKTKKGADENEFFVVPSRFVAENTTGSEWRAIHRTAVLPYKDKWDLLSEKRGKDSAI